MKGLFLTFEGPEGAGKTTILELIHQSLAEQGYPVILTREPGGIEIAEKIREVILNPEHTAMDARTEALLYAAARRQHLAEKVFPALLQGKMVLCDRFIDSSLVYQGMARGIGVDEVLRINEFAMEGLWPTGTLLFDLEPEIGLGRIRKNENREMNRLDLEGLAFHKQVREGYLQIASRFPGRINIVNANQTIAEVFADSMEIIKGLIISQ